MKYTTEQYKQAVRKIPRFNMSMPTDDVFCTCPRHSDRRPSLSISFGKGIFNCLQCGYSGTIASLVWDQLHLTMKQVLGLGATNEDWNLGRGVIEETLIKEEKVDIDNIQMTISGELIPFNKSPQALEYMKIRGIEFEVAKNVGALFAKDCYINKNSFNNRFVIPIYAENGKIVNYEGRDTTFKHPIKCIYPKGAIKPIFQYYCLDRTKPLYLFEGLIKVLVARSDSFFANSTTSMGTGISSYQLEQLKAFPKIVICPDNDNAGKLLINRVKNTLGNSNNIRILRIADQSIKDMDEIPKKTGLSVEEYRKKGGFFEDISF